MSSIRLVKVKEMKCGTDYYIRFYKEVEEGKVWELDQMNDTNCTYSNDTDKAMIYLYQHIKGRRYLEEVAVSRSISKTYANEIYRNLLKCKTLLSIIETITKEEQK